MTDVERGGGGTWDCFPPPPPPPDHLRGKLCFPALTIHDSLGNCFTPPPPPLPYILHCSPSILQSRDEGWPLLTILHQMREKAAHFSQHLDLLSMFYMYFQKLLKRKVGTTLKKLLSLCHFISVMSRGQL